MDPTVKTCKSLGHPVEQVIPAQLCGAGQVHFMNKKVGDWCSGTKVEHDISIFPTTTPPSHLSQTMTMNRGYYRSLNLAVQVI